MAGIIGLAPPAAAGEVGDAAVLATSSVQLKRAVQVTGNVVVNDASTQTLVPGFELSLDRLVVVTGDLAADSLQLKAGAVLNGTASCNNGTGVVCTGLPLPVFAALPLFQVADVRPNAADVFVASGQVVTLAAGEYGNVVVASGGGLVLSGGTYDLRSLDAGSGSTVEFLAAASVRIEGRFHLGQNSTLGPASGSAIGAADVIFYVGGINGADGGLFSLPPAAEVEKDSFFDANLYAPFGSIELDRGLTARGAFLGRDVLVDRDSKIVADSFFANRPPIADPQEVFTLGADSLEIILTGSDPNGDSLTFSHVAGSGPTAGTLSAITEIQDPGQCSETVQACSSDADCPGETCVLPPITSALVTYSPNNPSAEEEDGFSFRVTDTSGAFDDAEIAINPPGDLTEPPPVTGVTANPTSAETLENTPVTVFLSAQAPVGCTVTFSVVNGPDFGSVGAVTSTGAATAEVLYTPPAGFTGTATFELEAAANLGGGCSADPASATATATVIVAEAAPTQADNQTVTTPFETPVEITLTGTPGSGGGFNLPGRLRGLGEAAFLEGSEIAGNVADFDRDGFGDNHNALPGPVPVLMAAAVDAEGGPGSNGIVRMHIEWDISELSGLANELVSAEVLLNTVVGTIDSLDTLWYPGTADNDGLLTDSDFESEVDLQNNPLATMPVPDEPPGTEGTFSFDVLDALRLALQLDHQFFYVQGRVDEDLDTNGEGDIQRGLQVRTTADGNLPDFLHPQLSLTTPGVVAPLTFTVTTLPKNSLGQPIGTLRNSLGATISSVPAVLPDARLTFTPATAFEGVGSFQFQATDGVTVGTATVTLVVASGFGFGDCLLSEAFCAKGRSSAGGSGFAGSDTAADYALKVAVRGRGDVSSSPRQIKNGMPVGLFCAGAECTARFPSREMVALFARPAEAGWVFAGWGGDCSGSEPMTLVRMSGDRKCTARFERDAALRKGTK